MDAGAKAALRERARAEVRAITAEQRRTLSLRIVELLLNEPVWRAARFVFLFAPLKDEPDVSPLLDRAIAEGKRVAFPRYDSSRGVYAAAAISSPAQLRAGRFGALEPEPDSPALPLNQLDLALVPGIAFDLAGRRLGRGKGFYDRLLAEVAGHKCGVAFDTQIVARIPEEPHDVRVNSILTPTRWHLVERAV